MIPVPGTVVVVNQKISISQDNHSHDRMEVDRRLSDRDDFVPVFSVEPGVITPSKSDVRRLDVPGMTLHISITFGRPATMRNELQMIVWDRWERDANSS